MSSVRIICKTQGHDPTMIRIITKNLIVPSFFPGAVPPCVNYLVIWSETVGLTTGLRPKKIGLAGLVLCCETQSYYARRHNDLERTATFQVPFIVSLFCAWNITIVEIKSGVYLLKN